MVEKNIQYSVNLNSNGELFVTYFGSLNNQYNNYKLAIDVLGFNIVPTGEGELKTLYYINYDGSISTVNTKSAFLDVQNFNNKLEVTNNIGSFKNIISVVSGSSNDIFDAQIPLLIDIYGNNHSL